MKKESNPEPPKGIKRPSPPPAPPPLPIKGCQMFVTLDCKCKYCKADEES